MTTRRCLMIALLACVAALSACSGPFRVTRTAGAWVDCSSLACNLVARPLVLGACYLVEQSYVDPFTRYKEHSVLGLHVDSLHGTTLLRQANGEAVATSIDLPGLSIATGSADTRRGTPAEYLAMWVRDDSSWIPIVTPPVSIDSCFVESDAVNGDERQVVLECVGTRFPADWRRTPYDDEIVATLTVRAGLLTAVDWYFDDGTYTGEAASGSVLEAPESHLRISFGSELNQLTGETETVHVDDGFPTLHVGCAQDWADRTICEYRREGGRTIVNQRLVPSDWLYSTTEYFAHGDTVAAGSASASTSLREFNIRRVPCDSIPPMDEELAATE